VYEKKILDLVNARLNVGFDRYGGFDPNCGKKWATEAIEEVMDGLVYCAGLLIQIEESMSEESKRKIGLETLQTLRGVLHTCSAARDYERKFRPEGSASAIRELCDLEMKIHNRISNCDGSEEREHREEMDRVCTTRTNWFPSRCPDMRGVCGSDFQAAVGAHNRKCTVHVEGIDGRAPARGKCHDPAMIAARDRERVDLIIEEIRAHGEPISVWRAVKASGLRADVISRLWGRGVDLDDNGLVVEVQP
jgi:hypothetical protein